MGPHPAVAQVRLGVRRCLAAASLEPGDLVLAACSGGADSLALAAALAFEAPKLGLRAGGVTVDHGLQPGSEQQAQTVTDLLTSMGLDPVRRVAASVARPGDPGYPGPEAAAREARYLALDLVARDAGAAAIVLGHTLDDQAETVLLGLARGSGSRSLAGMPERSGVCLRPLLEISRAQTQAACEAQGLQPWQDPQNADPAFTRTRVRHHLIPELERELGPGVAPALARSARQLRADADFLDGLAARTAQQLAGGEPGLPLAPLAALPAAIRSRVLHSAAAAAGCPGSALSSRHVAALDALVTGWHGQRWADLPGGVRAERRYGRLLLHKSVKGVPRRRREVQVDEADMGADLAEVLIPADRLQRRVAELAEQIDKDYADRELLLVGVLKGAVMVMADLSRAIRLPVQMDWMAVSSYGSGTKSSGVVRILKDLDADISGRHVLVVEDIIDSGLTLSWLVHNLQSRGPASLRVCTLLRKPGAAQVEIDVAYTGFEIPSAFVVGYGLDYAERYRNLPFIGTLAPHVYQRPDGAA